MKGTRVSALFGFCLTLTLVAFLYFGACAPAPSAAPTPSPAPTPSAAPDKIVFGQVLPLSGYMSAPALFLEDAMDKFWVQDVNARGGIYVPQYDKRIPVDLIVYDDKSDVAASVKLYQKLITVDKVDMLLSPYGPWTTAVAPLANQYKYPIIAWTSESEKLAVLQASLPYFFNEFYAPSVPMTALVELMKDVGVKTAAVLYVEHELGIDQTAASVPLMPPAGIDVVILKGYPFMTTDLSPLLKQAKAAGVDALLLHGYDSETFLLPKQLMGIDFNPKFLYSFLACAWPAFKDTFGAEIVEGITCSGGWNPKVPYPGAQEFYDKFLAFNDRPPCGFGTAYGYAMFQVLEQSIAKVGFQDREKLRDVIATDEFMTVIGPVKFEDNYNIHHPGLLGQWQKGTYEIVWPKEQSTAAFVYPKPPWPK